MTTAITEKPHPYLIPVGQPDNARLKSLGDIFDPVSIEWIRTLKPQLENVSILDAGCGNGEFLKKIADLYPSAFCVGFDISGEQIEMANQEKNHAIEWKVCDVYHTEELKETHPKLFDIVHSRFVLTHLQDPEKAVDALLKMVKPGGVLILEDRSEKARLIGKPEASKAIDALWTMSRLQAQMQQSTWDTAERIEKHLATKKGTYKKNIRDVVASGPDQKSTYRVSIAHGIQKITAMGKPELFQKFGYQDPQQWLQDIDALISDDKQTVVWENFKQIAFEVPKD